MLRSRSRDDRRFFTVHFRNNTLNQDSYYTGETCTFLEAIDDGVGNPGGIHQCSHRKIGLDFILGSYSWNAPNGNSLTVSPYIYGIPPAGTIETLFPVPSSVLLAGFTDRAFEALSTQVPQEVSLPNFLYEFREIGSLIPELGESMAKTVSGGFLNYSFGWKPLIGDLQKLHGLMETVRKRIAYLKATYGRETRLSYSEAYEVEGNHLYELTNGDRYYRDSSRGIFRAGGYLFHLLQGLDGIEGTLRAASAALGLNNPLGVVWEAIPFSFVADWFGRIQSAVNHTAVAPFVGEWSVRRLCWSFTCSGTWHKDLLLDYGASPERVEQIKGTWTQYFRDSGLPVSDSLLSSTALDSRQQMLASALIHQSVR